MGDGGWSFAHDNAPQGRRKNLATRFPSFVGSVAESADAERVIRDMVGQGNKLILAPHLATWSPCSRSRGYQDVKFGHATGYKTADNPRTCDSRTYEGAYMAGVIAGKMTKTGTLGVVASGANS
ncbi:BMP family ABC transporter substrate-binding protein [Candidatus Aalborgicola defluviihabitans]|uniref:BMP family ABC transporter substrate-binding protein n=1 Tax=Candidatus Aalborgicola defluviihabitans TaxID=3386187 RepID=UPI0039B934B1